MPDAILTNSLTNALHAIFLFIYFAFALANYLKKEKTFPLSVVLFFLTLFLLKAIGTYVHYKTSPDAIPPGWIAISLLTIMLNYFLTLALTMSDE